MISDYINPHGREIEPNRVEEIHTEKEQYRVVRLYGLYYVEMYLKNHNCWDKLRDVLYNKPAIYPTLHEAENFICRHRKPEIHYYY